MRKLGFISKTRRAIVGKPFKAWVRGEPEAGTQGYGLTLSPADGRPMLGGMALGLPPPPY